MYAMVKQNDGKYVMTEIKHYGKGHLDGGHSGRYPWGSGDNPKQRVLDTPEKKRRVTKAAVLGTIFGGPIGGLTAGYISFRRIEREALKSEEVQEAINRPLDEKTMEEGKNKFSEVVDKMKDSDWVDPYPEYNLPDKAKKGDPYYKDLVSEEAAACYEIFGFIPDYNNIKKYPKDLQPKLRQDAKYLKDMFGEIPDWSEVDEEVDKKRW